MAKTHTCQRCRAIYQKDVRWTHHRRQGAQDTTGVVGNFTGKITPENVCPVCGTPANEGTLDDTR